VNKKKQKNFIILELGHGNGVASPHAPGSKKFFGSPGGEPFFKKELLLF
jgi:hypothetical protein